MTRADRFQRQVWFISAWIIPFDHWEFPLHNGSMSTTVTLDSAGRVLIPKALRDKLHLEAGDTLELESEGERLALRPVRSGSSLRKELGVWVFRRGAPGSISTQTTNQVLDDLRSQRDQDQFRPLS